MKFIKNLNNASIYLCYFFNSVNYFNLFTKKALKLNAFVLIKANINKLFGSFRIINNYSLFSSIISKMLTSLKIQSLVGFSELNLVVWDLGFAN